MLTPLNTIFVRETVKEKYWERWRGGKGKRERERQTKRQSGRPCVLRISTCLV